MRTLVVICIGLLVALVDSQKLLEKTPNGVSRIIKYSNENNGADGYNFFYETEDGTMRKEKGEFVNGIWTVTGTVQFRTLDGEWHNIKYKADDKGYQQSEPTVTITEVSYPKPVTINVAHGISAGALASLAG